MSDLWQIVVCLGLVITFLLLSIVAKWKAATAQAQGAAAAAGQALGVAQTTIGKLNGDIDGLKTAVGHWQSEAITAQGAAAAAGAALGNAQTTIGKLTGDIDGLKDAIDKLKRHGVEVIFCVDNSGSMSPAVEPLKQAITGLSAVLPAIGSEVRIGVLLYERRDYQFSELKAVKLPSEDGGKSLAEVTSFLTNATMKGGLVASHVAVEKAIAAFGSSATPRRQVLVVATDAAWEESRSFGRAYAVADTVALIKSWRAGHPHRTVIAFNPNRENRVANEELKALGRAGAGFTQDGVDVLSRIAAAAINP